MRDIMFEIPSNPKIEKCIITKETVESGNPPKIVINEEKVAKNHIKKKKIIPNKKSETA